MAEMRQGSELLRRMAETLKTNSNEIEEKFVQLVQELKSSRKQIEKMQAQQLKAEADRVLFGAKAVKGLQIITGIFPEFSADDLRQMGDMLRDRDESVVAVLAGICGEKISLISVCGSGGGKPERAMGGAKDELMLDNALATIDNYVNERVK